MRDDIAVRIATALETIAEKITPADTGTTETPEETTGGAKTTTKGGTK